MRWYFRHYLCLVMLQSIIVHFSLRTFWWSKSSPSRGISKAKSFIITQFPIYLYSIHITCVRTPDLQGPLLCRCLLNGRLWIWNNSLLVPHTLLVKLALEWKSYMWKPTPTYPIQRPSAHIVMAPPLVKAHQQCMMLQHLRTLQMQHILRMHLQDNYTMRYS